MFPQVSFPTLSLFSEVTSTIPLEECAWSRKKWVVVQGGAEQRAHAELHTDKGTNQEMVPLNRS